MQVVNLRLEVGWKVFQYCRIKQLTGNQAAKVADTAVAELAAGVNEQAVSEKVDSQPPGKVGRDPRLGLGERQSDVAVAVKA